MVKSFAKSVSFNIHTCKLNRTDNGRIEVQHNMRKRCDLVLNSVIRHAASNVPANAQSVLRDMQRRFSDTYTVGDIRSALTKLSNIGVIERNGGGYGLTSVGHDLWQQFKDSAKAK